MNLNAKYMKKIYKISGMNCPSCATRIEVELEDAGISAKCSYANRTLEIQEEIDKEKERKINEIVKKHGYTLTEIPS